MTIEIFWTGGYDSTFRILQLSQLPVKICPFYLSDNRKSEKMELSAIKNITEEIKIRKETNCEILPLEIVTKDQRISDKKITDAFNRLLEKDFMGSQYEWLGWFAKDHKDIELSIHEDDKAIELIKRHGKLKLISDDVIGDNYIIDQENSSEDVNTVFKNFHFPLAKYTKLAMKGYYLQWDCKEIMNMTWFCFNPIKGKPCGLCNPCKYTIEEGMTERFTKFALLKYKLIPIIKILKAAYRQIKKLLT
jgi:7-cyano-7-deazaguanine synthase